jgi:hypothetical protein
VLSSPWPSSLLSCLPVGQESLCTLLLYCVLIRQFAANLPLSVFFKSPRILIPFLPSYSSHPFTFSCNISQLNTMGIGNIIYFAFHPSELRSIIQWYVQLLNRLVQWLTIPLGDG